MLIHFAQLKDLTDLIVIFGHFNPETRKMSVPLWLRRMIESCDRDARSRYCS